MFDELESIRVFCENTKDTFVILGKVLFYIVHPKDLFLLAWNGIVDISFFASMLICLGAIIAYLGGWDKGKRTAWASFYAYIIIRMICIGVK
jgi:hypothetical protein